MSTPSSRDDESLLSAYFDGELQGEELERAKRRLLEHPEEQRNLDEFAALGKRLKELPRTSLGDQFAQRVLRRAEREILSPAGGEALPPGPVRAWASRMRTSRRPWVYAGAAAAAAVVLVLLRPATIEHVPHAALPEQRAERVPMARQNLELNPAPTQSKPASAARIAGSARELDKTEKPHLATAARGKTEHESLSANQTRPIEQALAEYGFIAALPDVSRQIALHEQQAGQSPLDGELTVVRCKLPANINASEQLSKIFGQQHISLERAEADADRASASLQMDDRQEAELLFVLAPQAELDAALAQLAAQPGARVEPITAGKASDAATALRRAPAAPAAMPAPSAAEPAVAGHAWQLTFQPSTLAHDSARAAARSQVEPNVETQKAAPSARLKLEEGKRKSVDQLGRRKDGVETRMRRVLLVIERTP